MCELSPELRTRLPKRRRPTEHRRQPRRDFREEDDNQGHHEVRYEKYHGAAQHGLYRNLRYAAHSIEIEAYGRRNDAQLHSHGYDNAEVYWIDAEGIGYRKDHWHGQQDHRNAVEESA